MEHVLKQEVNMNHHQNREAGFSLIETMVALLIITVGMLGTASMLIAGIKANSVSEERMEIATLAQSVMANIESQVVVGYTQTAANAAAAAQLANIPAVTSTITFSPNTTLIQGSSDIAVQLDWINRGDTRSVILRSKVVAL
jgi:type IV pilus assembly protein PilV